jgi:hypothetical protein
MGKRHFSGSASRVEQISSERAGFLRGARMFRAGEYITTGVKWAGVDRGLRDRGDSGVREMLCVPAGWIVRPI